MLYKVIIKDEALKDLKRLLRYELIYRIFDMEVHVDVLAAYGHYDDK